MERSMACALPPTHMTADERLDEIASILAAGIARLLQKKSTKSERTENICLDNSVEKSAHVVTNH